MLIELYCIYEFITEPFFFNLIFQENDFLFLYADFNGNCCTNFLHKHLFFFDGCGV